MHKIHKLISCFFVLLCWSACGTSETAADDTLREVRGVISFGPERMSFYNCADGSVSWFDTASMTLPGWEAVQDEIDSQPYCAMSTMPCDHQNAVVTGTAEFQYAIDETGERITEFSYGDYAGFGHMGMYPSEVRFTDITVVPGQRSCADGQEN